MKKISFLFAFVGISTLALFAQHTLPTLPFAYGDLEPYIDSTTMRIHYTVHHAGYVKKLNKSLEAYPQYQDKEVSYLLKHINQLPKALQKSVRNNGGGHYNHTFFWSILAKSGTTKMDKTIKQRLIKDFGSVEKFKMEFEKAAGKRFGSGWVWLIKRADGSLYITSTPNQDNMLMPYNRLKGKPILALDVWEHAYYLKYQSGRGSYAKAFWNVVNWDRVHAYYTE